MRSMEQERLVMPSRSFKDMFFSKFLITAENIPYSVYPLVEFMKSFKPNYAIALDRGGRITGFTLFKLYQELYGELPTEDHLLHFRKISRRSPHEYIYETLRPFAQRSMEISESPRIFIVDDWINTGITKRKIKDVFFELSGGRIQTAYGVMRGWGADVVGDKVSMANCTWHNNDALIGVEYSQGVMQAHSLRSQNARELRRRISESVKEFAGKIREKGD